MLGVKTGEISEFDTFEKFYNAYEGGKITELQIKPIETWGNFRTNAELEFLIPAHRLKNGGK